MNFKQFMAESIEQKKDQANKVFAAIYFTDLVDQDDELDYDEHEELNAIAKREGFTDLLKDVEIVYVSYEDNEGYDALAVYLCGDKSVIDEIAEHAETKKIYKNRSVSKSYEATLTSIIHDAATLPNGLYDIDTDIDNFIGFIKSNVTDETFKKVEFGNPTIKGSDVYATILGSKEDLEKVAEEADLFYSDYKIK